MGQNPSFLMPFLFSLAFSWLFLPLDYKGVVTTDFYKSFSSCKVLFIHVSHESWERVGLVSPL